MAAIGIMGYLAIASTAVTAYGMYQQGQARRQAADHNAKTAAQNAIVARQQADSRATQQDRLNRLRIGAIQAKAGAGGGRSDEGSVIDLISDAAIQGELQKQYITYEGELQARGFEGTAALDRASADAAGQAGAIGAGSALISGGADTYSLLQRG